MELVLDFIESEVAMPLMNLPVRTVIIKSAGATQTLIISPGSQLKAENFAQLNNVCAIVAPSLLHTGGIRNAKKCFENADIWGPANFDQKFPDLKCKIFGKDPWPFPQLLTPISLKGLPKVNETLFLHPDSRSLLITDLCFNLQNIRGFGAFLILHVFGTYNRLACSRLFTSFIKDRQEFRRSIQELMQYEFDNLIVSHGQNIYGGGRDKLLACLKERNLI